MGRLLQTGVAPVFAAGELHRALFQPERPVFSLAGPAMTTDDDRQSRELTNQVLIQIRDNLAQINRKQDEFGKEQIEQGTRIVRLEERNERLTRAETHIAELDAKIEVLTADKHKRDGAIGLASWFSQHYPFVGVSVALAAFVAWVNGLFGKGAP
jgi:hypothetical protein